MGGYICHALYCQDVIGHRFLDAFDPHQTTKQLARRNTYGPPVTLVTMISRVYSVLRNERDRPASFGGWQQQQLVKSRHPYPSYNHADSSFFSFGRNLYGFLSLPPNYVLRSTSLRSSSTANTSRGMKFDDSLAG